MARTTRAHLGGNVVIDVRGGAREVDRLRACALWNPGAFDVRLAAVSLSQLEYFVAVADARNVGRAAASLHVAQPAISRQIRHLEDDLGAPLFRRTPRGMELSREGSVFLEHARTILGAVRAAKDVVAASARRAP